MLREVQTVPTAFVRSAGDTQLCSMSSYVAKEERQTSMTTTKALNLSLSAVLVGLAIARILFPELAHERIDLISITLVAAAFAKTVKITFFQGVSLKPVPPLGTGKQLRGIDLRSPEEFDGRQLASWIRQAAKLPGMGS